MKRKEKDSLINMVASELEKQMLETNQKIMNNAVKRYTEAPKNSRESKMLRNKRAVILTYLRQYQLGRIQE